MIGVVGDFGRGTNLSYSFFNVGKIDPGDYRFSCRVRGTPGQIVRFDVADSWRSVSEVTVMPLAQKWQEHVIAFEVKAPFKSSTRLRFAVANDATGEFHVTDTHLRRTDR